MAGESRLVSGLRRAARGVYAQLLFATFAAFMNLNSGDVGGLWKETFPFSAGVEGSLNVHSCVADFLVSSLRDLTYVTFDQVVFPVCDSTSGPLCPHLKFPPLLPEVEGRRRRPFALSNPFGAYSAHLHRPLLAAGGEEEGSNSSSNSSSSSSRQGSSRRSFPTFVQLDTSRTYLHAEPLASSRVQRHSVEEPYAIRGQYLEDGVGDVASPSLSDAISTAIGHLGAVVSSTREIWDSSGPAPADSFLCFHEGDPEDRSDCHDLAAFSSLPRQYEAEVVPYHSGWRGSSRLLLFDSSRAPFLSPYLEADYAVGLPEAETRWKGRWLVKPTQGLQLQQQQQQQDQDQQQQQQQQQQEQEQEQEEVYTLPLTGFFKESITAQPSSYASVLNRRGPPGPISTYAELDSHEGSFLHSNLFVPFGIWVAATPRSPSPSCSTEALQQSSKLVLIVQGLQDEEVVFTAEVPLYSILGLHAAGPQPAAAADGEGGGQDPRREEQNQQQQQDQQQQQQQQQQEEEEEQQQQLPPPEYRFVNALDFVKTTPLQRIDVLRFSYGYSSSRNSSSSGSSSSSSRGAAERVSFRRPLHCSKFRAALGALHLLLAEKALSSRVYYTVDARALEGKLLREQAHAARAQQQQQQQRKLALTDAKATVLKQLLGGPLPRPWRPHKIELGAPLRADVFSGNETEGQREGGVFMGVLLRAQQEEDLLLLQRSAVSASSLPLSWQENNRIKFGRFDSMPYQFADLRKPLKRAFLFLQDIPAEAPVLSLSQISQLKHVFFRKPVPETHGRFKNVDLDSAGIGDLRSLMKSILSSLETKKDAEEAAATLLEKLTKEKAAKTHAAADAAADAASAAAADTDTESTQTETADIIEADEDTANISQSLSTLAETLAKSSPGFKNLLQKVSERIGGGAAAAAAAAAAGAAAQQGGRSGSAAPAAAAAADTARADKAHKSEGGKKVSAAAGDDEEDEDSSSSSSSSKQQQQKQKQQHGSDKLKGKYKKSKEAKDIPQAAVQAVLIMGPDGQVINFEGPGVNAAEVLSNMPETFLKLAQQMGMAVGAEAGESMLKSIAAAAAAAAKPHKGENNTKKAGAAASHDADKKRDSEDINKKNKAAAGAGKKGSEAAKPSSSSSSSSSSKSSNNSNNNKDKDSSRTKNNSNTTTNSSNSNSSSSNSSSSNNSSSSSSSSSSSKPFSLPPDLPEGLFGETIKMMMHADSPIVAALMRAAEMHAQRIIAATAACAAPAAAAAAAATAAEGEGGGVVVFFGFSFFTVYAPFALL
ncbi:hypothetical protein, conserved [Eimeria brunetti]|uniref:Uncharacterized protein n=1 Tax=Eimeria brunetti TaxID=51314 RepID=U6LA18_9EIME|nr:hypothetical protein, conserved [Eimeria brunetti]